MQRTALTLIATLLVLRPDMHDAGPKNVLGHEIPGGGNTSDGEQVLDLLAQHPSTARFSAAKLARRFVSDDPPTSLVERAAERSLGSIC